MTHVIADLNRRAGREVIRRERHRVSLREVPRDVPYFFGIRNPVDRFVSGFYSRKRKGQPRTQSEWTSAEAWAFGAFADANDLAEALFEAGETGWRAMAAIKSIQHTYRGQIDWLDQLGDALLSRPPVWILRQEHFGDDLSQLLERLGVDATIDLEIPTAARHANDYSRTPQLSDRARGNLERWYVQDFVFYAACEGWMAKTMGETARINTSAPAVPPADRGPI